MIDDAEPNGSDGNANHDSNNPQSSNIERGGEVSALVSQIEQIRQSLHRFPYDPVGGYGWITKDKLEHWRDDEGWATAWGVSLIDQTGHAAGITVRGPRTRRDMVIETRLGFMPKFDIIIAPGMTYEEEEKTEEEPVFGIYYFSGDGKILKRKDIDTDEFTCMELDSGDYKTLDIALNRVKSAIEAADQPIVTN